MNPTWLDHQNWKSPRWKTAIKRDRLSSPVRLAVERGFVNAGDQFLDFGCGRGDDVMRLIALGVEAGGYDPYYFRNNKFREASIVNCSFVINVIEQEKERTEVLKFVWELAISNLIVSVRTDNKPFGFTSIGTYQRYYTQQEFLTLMSKTLPEAELTSPKSGVAFLRRKQKVIMTKQRELVDDAIASLKSLNSRTPDPEVIARFPGAGVLKEAGIFTNEKPVWVVEARETIQSLITQSEFASLRNVGMLNQHFTSSAIAHQMWNFAFEKLEYRKLKVLDPGCGMAGFYHSCPHQHLIEYVGVEVDGTTARMAKYSVGSNADIYWKDFLKWEYPVEFDLAIGNVPFVNGVKKVVLDSSRINLGLHAQFFMKTIRHLRSGGLLVFLTSASTLDSVGEDYIRFRSWMSDRTDFLGAVRLPNDGSAHVGKTEVTTDLVILRKK